MGSLVFEVDQKFKTKGIWAKKGTKNLILSPKEAAAKVTECGTEINLLFGHIDIDDGESRMSWNAGKKELNPGGELVIKYDESQDSFSVSAKGVFSLEIEDTFIKQFKEEGAKLQFRVLGVVAKGGPVFGGYISRHEKFDRDLSNYSDCPSVVARL
jgi:hypothetical protein